jgi:multisubunit Na+/H+ antiporter MnhF subunit
LINTILTKVYYHMINTWLVTVFCLIVLSVCAVLRVIPGPARDDRFVALNTAITLAAGAALGLSIYWGNIVMLDISLVLIGLCYAGTIVMARSEGGEKV